MTLGGVGEQFIAPLAFKSDRPKVFKPTLSVSTANTGQIHPCFQQPFKININRVAFFLQVQVCHVQLLQLTSL